MLRLVIFVSIISFVDGLISIKSQPTKVINGDPVKLACDVGTMKNTVKWVYGGVTYFSCDSPYTNCFTNTSIIKDGLYDFSINDQSLIVLLFVGQNQNDGIWSCYHGNDKADIEIDNADAPKITNLRSSSLEGENMNYLFRCSIESQVPADVVIYSHTYLGVRKLYEMNQTRITEHNITSSMRCEDYNIFCNVSNGYGPPISNYRTLREDSSQIKRSISCPLKILHNLFNTTLTFSETFWYTRLELKVYYEGYPEPSPSLHRFTTDSFQEVTKDVSLYQYGPTLLKPRYIYVSFSDLEESDAGKYVLALKQNKQDPVIRKEIITLVYTGRRTTTESTQPPATTTRGSTQPPTTTSRGSTQPPTTTTTESTQPPTTTTRGSTQPPTTTSRGSTQPPTATTRGPHQPQAATTRGPHQPQAATTRGSTQPTATITPTTPKTTSPGGMFESKTKDEIKIMVHLGVTGFVLSLIMVLILVVVGVFWFNRLKRKSAGSEDQVYSTTVQMPRNTPNHIYEDLKK